MAISAFSGPVISIGQPGAFDYNGDAAPSLFYQGVGLLDPRTPYTYQNGQRDGQATLAFLSGAYVTVDQAPSTLAVANIAASQSPAAGAITLVSVTGAGITAGVSLATATNGTVTGLLAIDAAMAPVTFGQNATVQVWNPATGIARNVRITSGGNDTGITFTVIGYDIYGYPMTETITGASAGVASGKKAFKYISSVTHTGSVASTMSIGTGDVFGFGLKVSDFFYADIFWNGALITATTGFLAADATSPATATTGDVRGTYAVQSASDGTKKLQIIVTPSVANLNAGTTGLFGVTQV